MPEELYNSHDYCLLVDEYEALKLENEELITDKKHLINAAMDGGNTYHYAAHDIGYRDMERKVKALEADYDISNRELLVKQVEIDRLTAELTHLTAELAELRERAPAPASKNPSVGVYYRDGKPRKWTDKEGVERDAGFEVVAREITLGDEFRFDAPDQEYSF